MSYLKFRPLNQIDDPRAECLLIAWPVLTIPVRFWGVSANPLDILEKAILALVESGVRRAGEIQNLLGIPPAMKGMVERTLRQLQSRGYVSSELALSLAGAKALEDEMRPKEFSTGWLFYDRVRGRTFPFVQVGQRRFFRIDEIKTLEPVPIPPTVPDPEASQLRREASWAVAAHNRRIALRELIESEGRSRTYRDDTDRELDVIDTFAPEALEVDDVQVLSTELVEPHHLLVEVVGRMAPGVEGEILTSYSPFSFWEQDSYCDIIRQHPDQAIKGALQALRESVKASAREELAYLGPDSVDTIIGEIERRAGANLPNPVVDRLLASEYSYRLVCEAVKESRWLRRDSAINDWGTLLEFLMKQIAAELDNLSPPPDWRKQYSKVQAWKWYTGAVTIQGKPAEWAKLPERVRGAVEKALRYGLPSPLGNMYCSSSRDYTAKILLGILVAVASVTPPQVARFITSVENVPGFLTTLDYVVDWRNDTAHGGTKVDQLSDDDFLNTLAKVRENVYFIVRQILGS